MLRKLKEFEYFEASSFSEAVSLLGQYGKEAWLIAGGTDLLVWMKEGARRPKAVINIKSIPEADQITFDEKNGLKIGSLVKISQIQSSVIIQERFTPLAQAAKELGSAQVRNLATIGGNLCTAAPSAETAPPLLALNAKVTLHGAKGPREVSPGRIFYGTGFDCFGWGSVNGDLNSQSGFQDLRGLQKNQSQKRGRYGNCWNCGSRCYIGRFKRMAGY